MTDQQLVTLTKKDFESDQEVRWCPGCGDYAILATLQKFLPKLGTPREKHVFISGIGCSSRFPYYMDTYGFHTIHGRAPAIATGLKVSRPELTVWVVTGDGDGLSIGGNHLIHLMRRNVNVNVLLFNNRIYGLTKGQYSPTSEFGKKTKSTPYGSLEQPVNGAELCLAAGATFVARALAVDPKGLSAVLEAAAAHKGTSFVEIFQNCNVFNDGAFDDFADKKVRAEKQLELKNGAPLIFGNDNEKAIVLDGLRPKVVDSAAPESTTGEALQYDVSNKTLAQLMVTLPYPEFPVPMGVLYKEDRPTYETLVSEQIAEAKESQQSQDLAALLHSGDTWQVAG